MKKLFTLFALVGFLGIFGAKADVTVNFDVVGTGSYTDITINGGTFNGDISSANVSTTISNTETFNIQSKTGYTVSANGNFTAGSGVTKLNDSSNQQVIQVDPAVATSPVAIQIVVMEDSSSSTTPSNITVNWSLPQLDNVITGINFAGNYQANITSNSQLEGLTFDWSDYHGGDACPMTLLFNDAYTQDYTFEITASYNTAVSQNNALTANYTSGTGTIMEIPTTATSVTVAITAKENDESDGDEEGKTVSVRITVPSTASDLVASLQFMGGDILQDPSAQQLAEYSVYFPAQESGNELTEGALVIGFAQENGEPKYRVASVTATEADNTIRGSVDADGLQATINIPNTNNAVVVNFTLANDDDIIFTLDIDDASAVTVKTVTMEETLDLINGVNDLKVAADDNTIQITANTGYVVNSIEVDGNVISGDRVEVTNGMQITVTTSTSSTESFILYLEESETPLFASASYTVVGGTTTNLTTLSGENEISYNPNETVQVNVVPADSDATLYAYMNGVSNNNGTPASQTSTVYYGRPVDGSELAVYVNRPTDYAVTFVGEDDVTDYAQVLTNETFPMTNWANTMTPFYFLEGTEVTLNVENGYNVFLNEEKVEPTVEEADESTYTIEIVENSTIEITVNDIASGVAGIDAENNGTTVIYNLQGVRVNGNNLPAGIYIINGKKVAVRK